MTKPAAEMSPLVRARVAGALYLTANIFAPFTLLYLPSRFIVRGDPAATASNIMASESLFRFGIVGNLFTFIANIFLALALFQLLKVAGRNVAFLMVILFLVGVPIAMLNELTQLAVLQLLSGAGLLKGVCYRSVASPGLSITSFARPGTSDCPHIFWIVAVTDGLSGFSVALYSESCGTPVGDCGCRL